MLLERLIFAKKTQQWGMENNSHNDNDFWKIRGTIPPSFDAFYGNIMDLVIGEMRPRADKLCTRYDMRVGVFGPYPGEGKEIILSIARRISESGFGAVTGLGFFAPNQPDRLHRLQELMTLSTARALEQFNIPDYIWYRHFPKLVCKAVHHLSVVRGQRNEAEGCFSAGIRMMGVVLSKKISRKKKYCNYLSNCGGYSECMCPNDKFCFYPTLKARDTRLVCPFYDYVDIPWGVKQLFINERNRLVVTADLEKALDAVEGCLKTKHFKEKIQRDA